MQTATAAAAAPSRVGRRSIVGALRALAHEIAGVWRCAIARNDLHRLSDATLRDLGLHRSEIDSVLAEHARRAAPTRRRIADGALR